MNIRLVFSLALIFLSLVAPAAAQPPTDAEAREKLVGTWTIEIKEGAVTLTGEQQNHADGTFTSNAEISMPGKKQQIKIEGKWEVKDGMLIQKVTDSSDPEHIKIGHETRDTILEATDRTYRTRTERGHIEEYFRK